MLKQATKTLISEERPPVVVFLGHIDHGKSSILQAIKNFKITEKEAGGITQHIGAYQAEHQGKKITFIDTPGHEAFCQMRSRGAKVADIAILVVAAEEGVKPQTKEAIGCIKEAKIPTIVALNKIDKPQANVKKVKDQLAKEQIVVEDLGGQIPCVETSALQKTGIKELLDMILLVAQMQDFKAEIETAAEGVVIETYLDEKRGPTAVVLVKKGVLELQDIIGTDSALGKVKNLKDFLGNDIDKAGPSQPVVVLGFEKLPQVGEVLKQFDNLEQARNHLLAKAKKPRSQAVEPAGKKSLKLILKTDVLGSLEAIQTMLSALPQEEVKIQFLRTDTGLITEDDVQLALASGAKILGFQIGPTAQAAKLASQRGIKIFLYNIIYELVEAVKKLLKAQIETEIIRKDLGKLEVLKVFRTEKQRQIVGGRIIEGEVVKPAKVEVLRGEEMIGQGKLEELEKEKRKIEKGVVDDEVGLLYVGSGRIKEGDILKFYIKEKKQFNI